MPDNESEAHQQRYAFVVYDPPVPSLPWLVVCIGPDGKVHAVEAFATLEDAQAKTSECAEDFIRHVGKAGVGQFPPRTSRKLN
ncbi:hypothetical protein GCM10007890_36980 [Methylobacterium tardum]|uniref:Uncharacterized protein n=1 Tax=Methylobacterium tardum TaxID=374432 RepID=A0AA37THA8_9HYPH|nr:hypothetical protein GCM10007890_36980 [Methylobacterium tardum]